MTSLVEEALRELLAEHRERPMAPALPNDGEPGGRFLVDIDDKDALWAAIDADLRR